MKLMQMNPKISSSLFWFVKYDEIREKIVPSFQKFTYYIVYQHSRNLKDRLENKTKQN